MYAVIFSAELKNPEQDYAMLAERLRELAIQEYGCTKFISLTEANKEITISYWPTLKHIEKWKQNPEHKKAQALGRASVALGHP